MERPAVVQSQAQVTVRDTRLYAIGRYYWNLRTRDGVAKSIEYFSRVVANDPLDARGYAGLASANAIMADYGYGPDSPKVDIARAGLYARRALDADPQNAESYAVLGFIASWRKGSSAHLTAAVSDFRHAIALDPSSGTAHQWYGEALLQQGRVAEAYAELTKAAQLDPLSVATTAWLGTVAYYEGHYREAIAYAKRDARPLAAALRCLSKRSGSPMRRSVTERRAAESFRRLAVSLLRVPRRIGRPAQRTLRPQQSDCPRASRARHRAGERRGRRASEFGGRLRGPRGARRRLNLAPPRANERLRVGRNRDRSALRNPAARLDERVDRRNLSGPVDRLVLLSYCTSVLVRQFDGTRSPERTSDK